MNFPLFDRLLGLERSSSAEVDRCASSNPSSQLEPTVRDLGPTTIHELTQSQALGCGPDSDALDGQGPSRGLDRRWLSHYEIVGELGRGGMGDVFAAHDHKLDRKVAIKILRDRHSTRLRRRLLREATLMAKLSHPNVVPIYEICEHEGCAFIVMEHVEGMNLREYLRTPRPLRERLRVFAAAARGLIAAHAKDLVHRDFKPDNVLIGDDGRVRVTDFGLARRASDPLERGSTEPDPSAAALGDELTGAGGIIGTLGYMSPEQLRGARATAASDQFSYCVSLHEGVYGERPFAGRSLDELHSSIVLGEVRPDAASAKVPDWLRALVLRGLEPEPAARFESMHALLDALEAGVGKLDGPDRAPEYVFVAHRGRDKQAALCLAAGLLARGVRPWLDMWDLHPGLDRRGPLECALARAPAVLLCQGPGPWRGDELEYVSALAARIRRDPASVVRVGLPGASREARALDGELDGLDEVDLDGRRWDEGLDQLVARVGADGERTDWLAREARHAYRPVQQLCPYRGLEAFGEDDARWMFGRERELGELLALLRERAVRCLTVIGASGSGKSSLVMAGLCSALRNGALGDGRTWTIAYMRPGPRPCASLARALLDTWARARPSSSGRRAPTLERVRERLLADRRGLGELATELSAALGDGSDPVRLVLVVDQLEELFSEAGLEPGDPSSEAAALVANLVEASLSRGGAEHLRIVTTLRADFVQRSLEVGALARAIKSGTYFALPPMGEPELRAAIELPARRVGFELEPQLVEKLVSAAAGQAGRLPLLQHVLRELWHRRDARRQVIGHEAYAQTGGLEGAIAAVAERTLEALGHELGPQVALVARRLMTRLVHLGDGTAGDTRRPAQVSELDTCASARRVLDAFIRDARILVTSRRGEIELVELAHEALLREWSTLVAWLDADREALRLRQELGKSAQAWRDHGQREYLWGRARVDEAARVLDASLVELNESEREFLRRSVASVRRRGCAGWASVAAIVVSALAVTGIVVGKNRALVDVSEALSQEKATVERSMVDLERERARQSQLLSVQRGLRAQMLISSDSEGEALLLALQAVGADGPRARDRLAPEAVEGLERVLSSDAIVVEASAVLDGHSGPVVALAHAPDRPRLATGSKDHTARIWDLERGELVARLEGHADLVVSLDYSPSGDRLASASFDGTAKIWDPDSGELLTTLDGHEGSVVAVRYAPDGRQLVSSSADGTVKIWDPDRGELLMTLGGHEQMVIDLAYSPSGDQLASASLDGTAKLWRPASGRLIATLTGHEDFIVDLAYAPDGASLATASLDTSARIWDAATGALVHVLEGHELAVSAVAYSPDGARLATASWDRSARIWDPLTGAALLELEGHADEILALSFSPDGDRLATASVDETIRSWDPETGRLVARLDGHSEGVYTIAYSPDGSRVASASLDDSARIWAPESDVAVTDFAGHHSEVLSVAFSPDGALIATGGRDKSVRIWDPLTGDLSLVLDGFDGEVDDLAFSPAGDQLACSVKDGAVSIWDPSTGARLLTFADGGLDLAYSPDGTRLATAHADSSARIWDPATGEQLAICAGHEREAFTLAYSLDGAQLATVSFDASARIWDAITCEPIAVLEGHDKQVYDLAYSPDGARLATGSRDGTARLWDSASGALVATLEPRDPVYTLSYSDDGAVLATGGEDGAVRVWDGATGALLQTLSGHEGSIFALAFAPGSAELVSADDEGEARSWDVSTGELLVRFQGHTRMINELAFSPDAVLLASASSDNDARIWDPVTGALSTTLAGRIGLRRPDGTIESPISVAHLVEIGCQRLRPFADAYAQAAAICTVELHAPR